MATTCTEVDEDYVEKNIVFLKIIDEFPLMVALTDCKYWTGFFIIKGQLVRIAVRAPNFPSAVDAEIEGDKDSKCLFDANINAIKKVLNSGESVYHLMDSIKLILEKDIDTGLDESSTAAFDGLFYTNLLSELELIGLNNIEYVADDFREAHIKHFDSTGRKHILKFMLPSRYPHTKAKVVDELPFNKTDGFMWPAKMYDAYNQFTPMIENYIQFWAEMDDIDKNVRVIEPQQPNRSHTHRRILIDEKNILHIVLNPLKPRSIPEFLFSGPDMEAFTKIIDKNYVNWKENVSVIENLEYILNCKFMPKEDALPGMDANEVTCTICYVYNLEDETPETVCECGSAYHNKCLYELYLNECTKLKGSRLCVDCPVCEVQIKIAVVHQSNW